MEFQLSPQPGYQCTRCIPDVVIWTRIETKLNNFKHGILDVVNSGKVVQINNGAFHLKGFAIFLQRGVVEVNMISSSLIPSFS